MFPCYDLWKHQKTKMRTLARNGLSSYVAICDRSVMFLLSSTFINKILLSLTLEKPTFPPTTSPDSALYNKNRLSGKLRENWKIQFCDSSYPQWMQEKILQEELYKSQLLETFYILLRKCYKCKENAFHIYYQPIQQPLLLYLNKVLMGFSVGSKYCMKLLAYVGLELWHWLLKKKEVSNSLKNFLGGFWTLAGFFIFNLLSSLECYNHQLSATIHLFSIAN